MSKERPILFSTDMVRAILKGRKTQTRRILKTQPLVNDKIIMPLYQMEPEPKTTTVSFHEVMDDGMPYSSSISKHKCPYGKIGDVLWVRETWSHTSYPFGSFDPETDVAFYRADYVGDSFSENGDPDKSILGMKRKWVPSIHMPRSACRLILEITNIRVERLNNISIKDIECEGITLDEYPEHVSQVQNIKYQLRQIDKFADLWESINGENSWDKNPWVWCITFKVIEGGAA